MLVAALIVKRRLEMPRENISGQVERGGPLSKDSNIVRHDKDGVFEGSTVRGRTK